MKITPISSISKYLIGARIIGMGTTAICFLLPDHRVLKLYYNSDNKKILFKKYNMTEHLSIINQITNDSYCGPTELLIDKNNNIVAYLSFYIKGKTLHQASNLTLDEIINKYQKLKEDTLTISENGFYLKDLHDKNILVGTNFHIIDLDQGHLEDTLNKSQIFSYNMYNINKTIIDSLFDVKPDEIFEFYDTVLNELYEQAIGKNPELFKELLKKLEEKCKTKDVTSKVLKKTVLYNKKSNTYYRYD